MAEGGGMAYTSPFQTGTRISATDIQSLVDGLYSAKAGRGLSNNSKPTFSSGATASASSINTVISNCSGINYSSSILPTIAAGTLMKAYDMRCIEQYRQDLAYLMTCASGCTNSCWKGCSGAGCSSSGCSGNCSSGCGNYCTSCSGSWAWGCVAKCGFSCSGTGSCKGSCSGSCTNGCSSACLSSCNTICMNNCKNTCQSGCDNTNRIGSVAGRT